MSRVVYPEFEHGRRYVPARPNILRRVISRYQLVELTVIIGAIFLLWGGSSIERLPGLMTATKPLAWLEILPPRDHRRQLGPERRRGISAGRLQHARIGRQRRMSARARFVAGSDGSAKSACRDRRDRPAARPLRLRARHRGHGTVQLRSLLRHAQRARTGRRGDPDRRRPRRTLCLHQDVLPAAQGLVPLLKLAATAPKSRFQCVTSC